MFFDMEVAEGTDTNAETDGRVITKNTKRTFGSCQSQGPEDLGVFPVRGLGSMLEFVCGTEFKIGP